MTIGNRASHGWALCEPVTKPLPQEEWDRRAEARGVRWLGPVVRAADPAPAECVTCGYRWDVRPNSIQRGTGCPRCAGKLKVSQDEWDRRAAALRLRWLAPVRRRDENTPAECMTCGHHWSPRPNNVSIGHGCPKCAGAVPLTPEEWDERAAALQIEWRGPPAQRRERRAARCTACGYEWATTHAAVAHGQGCPRCAGQLPDPEEWHRRAAARGITWLEEPTRATHRTPARCEVCGHEWHTTPTYLLKGGCPTCGKRKMWESRERLSQGEWDRRAMGSGLIWLEPVRLAMEAAAARCLTCGYEWKPKPNNVQQGKGCPKCAGVAPVTQDEWDERAEAAGVAWLSPVANKRNPTPARCLACGHEWAPWPDGIARGHGCPRCSGLLVTQEEWEQRAAARNVRWREPVRRGDEPTPAECRTCGYEWSARPSGIAAGRGCPRCGGTLPITPDEYDRRAAAVGIRWLDTPQSVTTRTPAVCLTCDYEWDALPDTVTQGGGCPRCGGRLRITQEEWDARAALVNVEWLDDVPNADTRTLARCTTCDHEWMASPDSIRNGSACPACATHGFDITAPADLYLVARGVGHLMKVGIAGYGTRRVALHEGRGWSKLGSWRFPVGLQAAEAERAVLAWWRERGATFAVRDAVPFGDGYTEAVHIGRVDVPDTLEFIAGLLARQQAAA